MTEGVERVIELEYEVLREKTEPFDVFQLSPTAEALRDLPPQVLVENGRVCDADQVADQLSL